MSIADRGDEGWFIVGCARVSRGENKRDLRIFADRGIGQDLEKMFS